MALQKFPLHLFPHELQYGDTLMPENSGRLVAICFNRLHSRLHLVWCGLVVSFINTVGKKCTPMRRARSGVKTRQGDLCPQVIRDTSIHAEERKLIAGFVESRNHIQERHRLDLRKAVDPLFHLIRLTISLAADNMINVCIREQRKSVIAWHCEDAAALLPNASEFNDSRRSEERREGKECRA